VKNILFVTHENFEQTPVSRAMFYDVAEQLGLTGKFRVKVMSAGSESGRCGDESYTFRRSTQGKFDLSSVFQGVTSIFLFLKLLRGVDIVFFRSYPSLILYGVFTRFAGKKIVFDTRGLFFDELVDSGKVSEKWLNVLSVLERGLLWLSHKVICVTESQKSFYIDKFGVNYSKISVIPNGAPEVQIKKDMTVDGGLALCYVGSLVKWHAPELVRDFCGELGRRGVVFTLDVITRDLDSAKQFFDGIDGVRIYSHNFRKEPLRFDFGFCFIKGGVSKSVCYPVKFSEYLVSGTKVLSLDNVDVVKKHIEGNSCGILFEEGGEVEAMVDRFIPASKSLSGSIVEIPAELTFSAQVGRVVDLLSQVEAE